LRAYLHAEGGDVLHQAAVSTVPKESFFRIGPIVQLTVKIAPPFWPNGLILGAEYHYLSPRMGSTVSVRRTPS
jgi:hypothetical protein